MRHHRADKHFEQPIDAFAIARIAPRVSDAQHYDFTDLPLFTPPVKLAGQSGAIDAQRMLALINDYAGAFFDRHLLDKPAPLLDGPAAEYPQVWFVSRMPSTRSSASGSAVFEIFPFGVDFFPLRADVFPCIENNSHL